MHHVLVTNRPQFLFYTKQCDCRDKSDLYFSNCTTCGLLYHFCRQRLHSRRIQKSIGKPKKCCLFQGKAKSLYKGKSLLSIIFYPGKIAVVQAIEFMFEHRFDRCRQLTLIAKVYPLSARIIGLSTFNVLCVIKNEQFQHMYCYKGCLISKMFLFGLILLSRTLP